MLTENEMALKFCPHKPSLCLAGFPCPWNDKGKCIVAERAYQESTVQSESVWYFGRGSWSLAHHILNEEVR